VGTACPGLDDAATVVSGYDASNLAASNDLDAGRVGASDADAAMIVDSAPPVDAIDGAPLVDAIASDADASVTNCPASIVFNDGSTHDLRFGPGNRTLSLLQPAPSPVQNYAGDMVFPAGALQSTGVFVAAPADAGMLGPSSGAALGPWLGEVLLVPPGCTGTDVTGRTLAVDYLVPLLGPTVPAPNGTFLGSYHGGGPTYYPDATATDVANGISDHILSHTFSAMEAADVADNGVFLRLYMLGDYEVHLDIGRITWSAKQ
jgi:hypothetical protein